MYASDLQGILVFFAVHKTRVFSSVLSSQRHQDVFLHYFCVQLSQLYLATDHTSTFISHIFAEVGMP